jgi:hypothetical protein
VLPKVFLPLETTGVDSDKASTGETREEVKTDDVVQDHSPRDSIALSVSMVW